MAPTNIDLGEAIRRLRRARRLTIEELAFGADIHPTYLSGIERGKRNPTWSKFGKLADALDMSASELARAAEDESEIAQAVREVRVRIRSRRP